MYKVMLFLISINLVKIDYDGDGGDDDDRI
jgi:hypothetical protein